MSEEKLNQMQFCHKELLDTREELEATRNLNNHLNNVLDKKIAELDKANDCLQQITDAIRDEGTIEDVKFIMRESQ